jgi:hypothetical protein
MWGADEVIHASEIAVEDVRVDAVAEQAHPQQPTTTK